MSKRRTDIELLRIIAAFCIVVFHTMRSSWIIFFSFGVVFFATLAVYFAAVSSKDHSVKSRLLENGIPFAFWFLFYGMIELFFDGSFFPKTHGDYRDYLAPTAIHLWFLPFIAVALIAADFIKKINKKKLMALISATAAIAIISTAPFWRKIDIPAPYAQYAQTVAAALIGLFLAWRKELALKTQLILLIGLFAASGLCIAVGQLGIGAIYLTGLIMCLPLLSTRSIIPESQAITLISGATFGIYLVHPFIIRCLYYIRDWESVLIAPLTFLCSLLLVLTIQRFLPEKFRSILF